MNKPIADNNISEVKKLHQRNLQKLNLFPIKRKSPVLWMAQTVKLINQEQYAKNQMLFWYYLTQPYNNSLYRLGKKSYDKRSISYC